MTYLWADKYAPQKLEEVVGHGNTLELLSHWADSWEKGEKQKPLLFHGGTGVGKTSIAVALAKERDWELLELNASDVRNAAKIERIAGFASTSKTFTGKIRLILFDEIDGLYSDDRGGSAAVVKVISDAHCPIILTADDIWNQKLSGIRNACEKISLKKPHYASIANHLERIANKEKVKAGKEILTIIARNCAGDIRSAINDFQLLAQGKDEITEKDLEILGSRDRTESIFNAVRVILKSTSFKESRDSIRNLEEQPDFVLKWVDENIPKEYKHPDDLYNAVEAVSRADIHLGRVMRRQNYVFWRYASDMMSAGVSLSKKEPYHSFTMYAFPSLIRGLSSSKGERGIRKSVALKVGKQCHVSTRIAIQDYIPMLQELMQDDGKAAGFTAQFGFDEKELEFLGVSQRKKTLEKAEELVNKDIKQKIIIHDKHQKKLF